MTSTYVVRLPLIAKALLEETNSRYMFYEFVCTKTRFMTYALGKYDRKRVYARVPRWIYDMAKRQGLNAVGIYLVSVGWMHFFNARPDPGVEYVTVQVYRNFYKRFGDPLFPERYKPKIEELMSRWSLKGSHKVFDLNHRLAQRLRYVKQRYHLTRTNTLLLYLAYFLAFIKDTMTRW